MEKEFVAFLNEHDALKKFENNLLAWYNSRYTFRSYINDSHPYNYFYGAFPWNDSPEGEEFWKNLHNQWTMLVDLKLEHGN